MTIDHIAMYVKDLEASKAFFAKYFGAISNAQYHNPKTGLRTYFLSFDNSARLEIMNRPEMDPAHASLTHIGLIHIAFSVGSKEKVDSLTQLLSEDGFKVISGPRVTGDGCYESCVLGLDDCQIEITE